MQKCCTKCGLEKPTEQFRTRSDAPSRTASQCKACDAVYRKRHYDANPAMHRARSAEYRKRNQEKVQRSLRIWRAENKDKVRASHRAWCIKNEDRVKANRRAYYEARKSSFAERMASYYAANKAYFSEANRRWRQSHRLEQQARVRSNKVARRTAAGSFSKANISRIKAAQRNRCAYCRTALRPGFHIDHIRPISKGGSNLPCNLQLLCASCNHSKKDRLPEVHARSLGLLI